MNAKSILVAVVGVIVVLFASIFLGTAVGTSDFETLGGFGLLAIAIVCFAVLGKRIWVLIPVFAAWSGSIMVLPIPFSVSNIAVGFAVGCWTLLLLTRRVHWRFQFGSLDIWLVAILAILGIGYFRNPVGLAAFTDGGNVGARPYFEVFLAFCGYVLLANQTAPASFLRKVPVAVVVSGLLITIGGSISYLLPEIGIYMFQFYSGFMPDIGELDPTRVSTGGIGRAAFLLPFALALSLYLFASKPPLVNLSPLKPLRLIGVILAGVLVLLSGFRNAAAAMGMYFIIGMLMWWRGFGFLACLAMAVVGIALIAGVQSAYPLPERVQRPLSFLPGNWDDSVVRSAQESNEWRFDMWQEILEGNSIDNWWLGDGFGFPASELAYYGELFLSGRISPQQLADYYLMTGDLHSGPLSTIKFAGGIGLALFTIISLIIAWRYMKLWGRTRLTPLALPVGFYGITACYFPIKYYFVFGAFQNDLPYLIISAGLLRMFEKSAAEYETQQASQTAAQTVSEVNSAAPVPVGAQPRRPGALPV